MVADDTLLAAAALEYQLGLTPELESLEALLSHRDGFGLTTISPLQRAVCRVLEGCPLGELAEHPHVRESIGDTSRLSPGVVPAEVCMVTGIRTAKSMMIAARAIRMTQTADLSRLTVGETARVSLVSLSKDTAAPLFAHIGGNLRHSQALRRLVVSPPSGDTVVLRHPSGRPVEIKIVAGARAGGTLIARWSAGCVFDEAPRMLPAEEGVVNLDDARQAVLGRILPGCQIVYIGSPWAPAGPVYDMVREHHGAPSDALVVVRAPAWKMNPITWTPEKVAEIRQRSPETAHTDLDAEFADVGSGLLTIADIEQATRASPREYPPEPGVHYAAAMDPATRGNAWTLVIVARDADGRRVVVLGRQWIGSPSSPLDPEVVLGEVARTCRPYRIRCVRTDQWAADALRSLAVRHDLALSVVARTAVMNAELYSSLQARVRNGQIELAPDPHMQADLLAVRRRVTPSGVAYDLRRSGDGRHADYAAALSLALSWDLGEPEGEQESEDHRMERELIERDEREEAWARGDWWGGTAPGW